MACIVLLQQYGKLQAAVSRLLKVWTAECQANCLGMGHSPETVNFHKAK